MVLIPDIAERVRERRLTYLSPEKIASLYDCINDVKTNGVAGDFFEFGVALGGSGICISSELGSDRRYLGFDVFGMIPPPSEADGPKPNERYEVIKSGKSKGIGGDEYYGYRPDLIAQVRGTFSDFGMPVDDERICLVEGLFEDTLPGYESATVALAHIDCDWYEPVKYCLDFLRGTLAIGGSITLDDYNDWPGCKKATDEFLEAHSSSFERVRTRPHAVLRRV